MRQFIFSRRWDGQRASDAQPAMFGEDLRPIVQRSAPALREVLAVFESLSKNSAVALSCSEPFAMGIVRTDEAARESLVLALWRSGATTRPGVETLVSAHVLIVDAPQARAAIRELWALRSELPRVSSRRVALDREGAELTELRGAWTRFDAVASAGPCPAGCFFWLVPEAAEAAAELRTIWIDRRNRSPARRGEAILFQPCAISLGPPGAWELQDYLPPAPERRDEAPQPDAVEVREPQVALTPRVASPPQVASPAQATSPPQAPPAPQAAPAPQDETEPSFAVDRGERRALVSHALMLALGIFAGYVLGLFDRPPPQIVVQRVIVPAPAALTKTTTTAVCEARPEPAPPEPPKPSTAATRKPPRGNRR